MLLDVVLPPEALRTSDTQLLLAWHAATGLVALAGSAATSGLHSGTGTNKLMHDTASEAAGAKSEPGARGPSSCCVLVLDPSCPDEHCELQHPLACASVPSAKQYGSCADGGLGHCFTCITYCNLDPLTLHARFRAPPQTRPSHSVSQ
jgi:hypothetical protein